MATPIPVLETRRLILRPLDLADAPAVQRLFPQWEVVRHLNARVPWPYPPDGAVAHLRDVLLPTMARGEAWHWSLRLKTAWPPSCGRSPARNGGPVGRRRQRP